VISLRKCWKRLLGHISPQRLVFLDESGVRTNMTRGYARAVKGERAIDNVPVRKGKLRTIISSVRMNGDIIHMEIDGSKNTSRNI
jgi:hypothetical protein